MFIECSLKRDGGTEVVLGKNTYLFAPDKEGNHVCEVEDEAHISTLLNIPESFNELGKPAKLSAKKSFDSIDDVDNEPLDPDGMNNKELSAWAKEVGINPKSKQSISDYAMDNYEIDLEFDKNISCSDLIREVIKIDLEEAAEED